MKWGECKLLALQKIDPATNSLVATRNTKDYLNAILGVANRGLNDLATAGKYLIRHKDIIKPKIVSVLPSMTDSLKLYQHTDTDIEFSTSGKAYYFEVVGTATIKIMLGSDVVETIENTEKGSFTVYKAKVENPDNLELKIIFTGEYPYQFRNIAIYDVNFESNEDVWDYNPEKRMDMKEIASDFYKLLKTEVIKESGYLDTLYEVTQDYRWEGDSVLILSGFEPAMYRVHYYAYPAQLTAETDDEYELELDPEVAALLPLYIASQLMEDDDSSMAYYFAQQYAEGKQRLSATPAIGKAQFVDVNGW